MVFWIDLVMPNGSVCVDPRFLERTRQREKAGPQVMDIEDLTVPETRQLVAHLQILGW